MIVYYTTLTMSSSALENLINMSDVSETEKTCLEISKQVESSHGCIFQDLQISELCKIAFSDSFWVIEYINKEASDMPFGDLEKNIMTILLFSTFNNKDSLDAIEKYPHIIKYIDDESKTDKNFLNVVEINGFCLEFIPEELKTEEICLAACEQNGLALQFVPEELQTGKVCLAAVTQNEQALEYIN